MRNARVLALAVILGALAAPPRTQADPPLASEQSHVCDTVETAVYPGSRVQVKCHPQWTNPVSSATAEFFAVASSSALASQVASVGLAAQTSSKKVRIRFRTSSTDNPSGCSTGDCRKLVGIMLEN